MAPNTIFYSWQSDLPNSTNRGFIADCLDRAIHGLKSAKEMTLDPCLDRDTQDVPGAPDIARTIFEKIDAAAAVVADVSLVQPIGPPETSASRSRRTPNPNVLVEVGYAARGLGWDRLVLVHNLATGAVEELPFDLRQRRLVTYTLREGDEKAAVRDRLVAALRGALEAILAAPDRRQRQDLQTLLSELAPALISVITLGDEIDDRLINPWLEALQLQYGTTADTLRRLAASECAHREGLAGDFEELATLLDSVAHYRPHLGGGDELLAAVTEALTKARGIKASHIDSRPLARESLGQLRDLLIRARRELDGLSARAQSLADNAHLDDVMTEAARLGGVLLSAGYYNLEAIGPDVSSQVLRIGHALHIIETRTIYMDGGASERAVLEEIRMAGRDLASVVTSLA